MNWSWAIEALQHYAVQGGVVVVLVLLTLFWNLIARGMTTIFVNVKVRGEWKTSLDRGTGTGPAPHEDATLRQFIHKVWGHTVTGAGERYNVQGTITGDRLCMLYRAIDRGTDSGAILLTILANGNEMEGYEVGIDKATNDAYSYKYKWTRKP
jgi:hypothetical protein